MAGFVDDAKLRAQYYTYVHTNRGGRNEPVWRGVRVVKFPTDMILYAEVILKRRPDWIIETGTAYGGSALFFADMLTLSGGQRVITIDSTPRNIPINHDRIEQIVGSSVDPKVIKQVAETVGDGSVMVTLDSDHSTEHVARELDAYAPIVTRGQYLVVEDCWTRRLKPYSPWYAVEAFLKSHPNFKRFDLTKQFFFGVTRDGWLRKIR